jgi:hypothetical protein
MNDGDDEGCTELAQTGPVGWREKGAASVAGPVSADAAFPGEFDPDLVAAPSSDVVAYMFVIWKRSGDRTQVRFMPGCLIWSVVLSIALTILVNLLIRLF